MKKHNFRLAHLADFDQCLMLDPYISPEMLKLKIEQRQIFVMEIKAQVAGYLRLDLFWSRIPYIALIRLAEENRGQGHGSQFLSWLESKLKTENYHYLLSSSQTNEALPQQWHIQNGFYPIGQLSNLNLDGSDEVFYRKDF